VISRVEVRGADVLSATLRQAAHGIENMPVANARAADLVVARAKAYCPVRTGALQGSIHAVTMRGGAKVVASEGLRYGVFQHFGTRHNRATLFLTRALADTAPQTVQVYASEVQRLIREVRGA
jgi:HK97 gp10 family phage protein